MNLVPGCAEVSAEFSLCQKGKSEQATLKDTLGPISDLASTSFCSPLNLSTLSPTAMHQSTPKIQRTFSINQGQITEQTFSLTPTPSKTTASPEDIVSSAQPPLILVQSSNSSKARPVPTDPSSKHDHRISLIPAKVSRATQTAKHWDSSARKNTSVGSTTASVRIEWPSQTKERCLPQDLQLVGKMLCRCTNKQIASAVWKHNEIREHILQNVVKKIDKECSGLCSVKTPSCLRETRKENLLRFLFEKMDEELQSGASLLRTVLRAASLRQSKVKDSTLYWLPATCMAAAVCLKYRSPYMTAMQLIITIILTQVKSARRLKQLLDNSMVSFPPKQHGISFKLVLRASCIS